MKRSLKSHISLRKPVNGTAILAAQSCNVNVEHSIQRCILGRSSDAGTSSSQPCHVLHPGVVEQIIAEAVSGPRNAETYEITRIRS